MQEYFTVEQAVQLLGYKEAQIFSVMQTGKLGPKLVPAIVLGGSLYAVEIEGNGEKVKIGPGVFEIDIFPYQSGPGQRVVALQWDEQEMALVNMLVCYEPFKEDETTKTGLLELSMWDEGLMRMKRYKLSDGPIWVTKSEVVILRDSLLRYMENIGRYIPEIFINREFDYVVFIDSCRKAKMSDEVIAAHLENKIVNDKKLSQEAIGRLLLPKMNIGDDAYRKRGKAMIEKGRKLLNK